MSSDPTGAEIGVRLLAHLRRIAGMHSVEFAEPPSALRGGFETLIFAFRLAHAPPGFDGPLILRLFREADAAPRARFEASVNGAIARLGYPAPGVRDWSPDASVLGGAFLILERLPGENLMARGVTPALRHLPRLLADAQLRLHALDPQPVQRTLEAAGFPAARLLPDTEIEELGEVVTSLGLAGLAAGVAWLRAQRPRNSARTVVCHGDFHPLNLLAESGRVTGVVDWTLRHMKLAAREYDVGATLVLLTHPPVDLPRWLHAPARRVRQWIVRAYLARYAAHAPLAEAALRYYEALRLLGCSTEAGVHRLADLGRVERPPKPTAFSDPRVQAGMFERFRAISGVTLALPPARERTPDG
jgi:aminoglycoside phosphotransferase (APT) family kinase protein